MLPKSHLMNVQFNNFVFSSSKKIQLVKVTAWKLEFFIYKCKSICQYYGEYEQPIIKLDKNYNCCHYFIPFYLKGKLYYLTTTSKFTEDHDTIIVSSSSKILISVPFMPLDIQNTKYSSNQIINRLTKLLPFS